MSDVVQRCHIDTNADKKEDMVDWLVLTVAFVTLLKITYVNSGGGALWIGLIHLENAKNLNFYGDCCHGTRNSNEYCSDFCGKLFKVTVHGLNISNGMKQPSNTPIQKNTSVLFQYTGDHQDGQNPMCFNFDNWPGSVNISIDVYDDNRTGPLIDSFFVHFNNSSPSLFYTNWTLLGKREHDPSEINVLLRYYCNCENNCSRDAVCPSVSSTPGCRSIRNITANVTSTVSKEEIVTTACTTTSKQNYTTVGLSSTLQPKTTPEVVTTDVTTELSTDATATPATSPTTTTKYPTTNESTSTTTQHSSTEELPSTPSLLIPPSSVKNSTHSDIPAPTSDINTVGSTPRELFPDDNSDPMEYWPVIVGSLLGGLALIALIGFLTFYRRYQKARWRQDIYNVNPKILHRLEENGTTGRSDVALETEPV